MKDVQMKEQYARKLKSVRGKVNLKLSLRTLAGVVLLFLVGIHLYYLLWKNMDHASQALIYMNICIRVTLVLTLIYLIFRAYQKLYDDRATARLLDSVSGETDDLYQNAYELNEKFKDDVIVEALTDKALSRFSTSPPRIPRVISSGLLLLIFSVYLGIVSVWAMDVQNFSRAFRQFYTNKSEKIVYKSTIELSPGNVRIGKNTSLTIRVLNPETRLEHRLFYRTDKAWRQLALTDYRYTFEALDNDIDYYVENNAAKSQIYHVETLDEPYVKNWLLSYAYPAYTGLHTIADTLSYGNISAYPQTQVTLGIRTNVPVKNAIMRFADGTSVPLSAIDPRNYIGRLTVTKAQTWYLEMVDELGRRSKPEEKTISLIPDNPPQIKISFPAQDVMLNQDLLLPLIINADDDFGLQNCNLKFIVNEGEAMSVPIQSLIPTKLFAKDYIFDMKNLGLMPGSVVTYWAEVFDNSPAHQKAESTKYRAKLPSIEDIYREIERKEKAKQSELEQVKDKSDQLKQDFEEKRREILKDEKVDYQDKKELENLLKDQEQLAKQVDNIADDYQQLIEKMQANSTLSPEMLQKMMKIQELMEQISNEDLQKAMEKFNENLKNLDPDALRKAMENFKFSMEDFSQKIDQTLKLLESIKKEQAVQKALQISQEMEKMQSALQEKTSDPKQGNEKLAQEQKDISDKYENLKEELDKLDNMLDPAKDKQAKDQLSELQKDMQNAKMEKNLQDSQDQLQQNKRASAAQSQQEAMEKMRTFTKRLAKMKESMSSGSQQQIIKAIQTTIRELLIFSKNHEELAGKFKNDPYLILSDLIAEYDGIDLSLGKLYSNPQVLMFVPPKFFIDLTSTHTSFRDLFVNVNEMQYTQIPQVLNSVQKGLNLMIYDLMQALKNQGQGSGSGSGMQSLMQMLEQMGQEQMAMNMLTQSLMQQMQQQGGGMTPAMQQQMQKLASDQQRLADNLKRALQNNPDAQKQGNSLQQIIDEAESVSRQLKAGQINRDTLERQERIVSKLLDAQRSINQREMSQKRKGETNLKQDWESSGKNPDFETMRRSAMLDETYRSYPREYQQVILEYLKRVNNASGEGR